MEGTPLEAAGIYEVQGLLEPGVVVKMLQKPRPLCVEEAEKLQADMCLFTANACMKMALKQQSLEEASNENIRQLSRGPNVAQALSEAKLSRQTLDWMIAVRDYRIDELHEAQRLPARIDTVLKLMDHVPWQHYDLWNNRCAGSSIVASYGQADHDWADAVQQACIRENAAAGE